jgi:hypothetical protein
LAKIQAVSDSANVTLVLSETSLSLMLLSFDGGSEKKTNFLKNQHFLRNAIEDNPNASSALSETALM